MQEQQNILSDSYGRRHNYLRISLTDKCNFRCTYCMPSEDMKFMPSDKLMSASEIVSFVKVFKDLGVERVRFTGGEPLLRKDLVEIVKGISELDLPMSITTNGLLLHENLEVFKEFGLNDINVSIDSIDVDNFFQMTKRNKLNDVIENIELFRKNNFNLKLNVVVIKDQNHREILDLINWSASRNLPIRFIEYMPFFGNEWAYKKVFTQKEMLRLIEEKFEVITIDSKKYSTSTNYFIPALKAYFGIIPTVSNPFCQGCNRIRLTADGKIKNCLFSTDEDDLLMALRNGEDLSNVIKKNIERKKESAAGRINFSHEKAQLDYSNNRSMVAIGG